MESAEYHSALAALAWQIELGADESVSDSPVDRYDVPAAVVKPAAAPAASAGMPAPVQEVDLVAVARATAETAQDIDGLRAALMGFDHCDLKLGARNLVFSDGAPGARVMIITETPTRDEDREGRPFVGRAAQLLDKMLGAIDLSRESSVYIASVLPWRTPQDRDPKPEEIAMLLPFLQRHIALAQPDVLVLMGNQTCQALLGKRGITRLRGEWVEVLGKPALPMFHPEQLMRTPVAKRDAWADLLSVKAKLGNG
ncbi:uracil-DNA glycosylase [Tateyamaria sp.]|uniref:uracil-DNA glycosylase n=1 Tax=Tateyamaria sp. TaxID=1929288 RepID=UPI00329C8A51